MKIKDFIGREYDFLPHEHKQLPTTMQIQYKHDVIYYIDISPKEFPKGIITDIRVESAIKVND